MEYNRKLVINGSILLLAFFGLLFIFNPEKKIESPGYWIGILVGGVTGVLSCIYMKIAWGPIDIRSPNDSRNNMENSNWMPISVVAGIIVSRIISFALPEYAPAIGNCFTSWIFITLGYYTFQIWRKRPKN